MENKYQAIVAIAEGCKQYKPTANRVRKLVKAVYDFEASIEEITAICEAHGLGLATTAPERKGLYKDFPDCWSICLLAKTQWKSLRRIWGDSVARQLLEEINTSNGENDRFWWLYLQLFKATNSLESRSAIDWEQTGSFELPEPLSFLKQEHGGREARDQVVWAGVRQFQEFPEPQEGVKFPLQSEDWATHRREKYRNDCLARSLSEEQLIEFFSDFWKQVREARGGIYFDNLRHSLTGYTDQPLSSRPFYSATEKNFRHFLSSLHGFKSRAPWRVPLLHEPRLTMDLEGSLLRYGWQRVESIAAIAILKSGEYQSAKS